MSLTATAAIDLRAISERYFAAWANRDPDAIVAMHTDDTQFWTHIGGDPVVGRDAVRDTFAGLFDTFGTSHSRPTACSTETITGCWTGH